MIWKKIVRVMVISIVVVASFSCTTTRIPNNPHRAKNVIEKKAREINAIAEFHDLANPLTRVDTVVIKVPDRSGNFTSPSRFNERLSSLYDEHIFPLFINTKDTVEVERIRKEFLDVPKAEIDSVYEDDNIRIELQLVGDELAINYTIKSTTYEQPVTVDQTVIDTNVKWYEDRLIRITLFLIGLSVLLIVINNIIKRN